MSWKGLSIILFVILLALVQGSRRDACGTGRNVRDELLQIQHKTQSVMNVTCDLCEVAVEGTRDFIDTHNKTDKDVLEIIDFFCHLLKFEDKHVCSDLIVEYQGLFYYLIASKQITNAFACGVIGICPKAEFPQWNVTLTPTPPATPYPGPNSQNPSMYVLHITDIHIDQMYTPGLLAECGEPICCRPPNPVGSPAAGQWGDYRCDLSPALYENMLAYIAQNFQHLSYAIFTGDVPAHDVWDLNKTGAIEANTYSLSAFQKYLPELPLYPSVGNHEAVPVNEFAPASVTGQWNMTWLYDALALRWEDWLPTAALAKVTNYGYYSTTTVDGVRIISMNTNTGCNSENWFLSFPSAESADPDGQLQWLADTLDDAEQNNEIVYVIKHIGPSKDDCGNDWWRNYLNIIDRYKNIILGDFSGHTHDDIFTVSYKFNNDSTLRPITTSYFPGSVTPYSDENPGFRIYEIDSVTKAVIDFTEYAINLTKTNLDGVPSWQPIYSARAAYSLPDMSPESWHALSVRMGSNTSLLTEYWERTGKYSLASSCDSKCLQGVWCALWNPPPDSNVTICGM